MDGWCLIALVCSGRCCFLVLLGTFLLLSVIVGSRVPLAQLFFQVVVLLSKAFYSCGESLYLAFEGNNAWFISLVVAGCHRASEYHTTLCLGSGSMTSTMRVFPTDGTNWWWWKSLMRCTVLKCSRQNMWNRNKEDFAESTGVVSVKYPSKVKLERLFTTLEWQSWEKYAYLGLWEIWGFYSGIELAFVS